MDLILEDVLKNHEEYEMIYIVDVNMSEEMAKRIDSDQILKEKIKVFDHHASRMNLNKYFFEQVVDERNGHKECGTTLFYEYLKSINDNPLLNRNSLKTMMELIRQGDTFSFEEEQKDLAFQFGSLYYIYGREKYIEHFYQFILENEEFYFSDVEKTLIELNDLNVNKYIEEKLKRVKKAKIDGISVGIVFAEQNRSLLGHEMAKRLDIDIAVIINVDRSVSYRAEKDEVDVSILVVPNGGGGHKHAGGSPLPNNLQEKICELIFKNIEWEEV